MKRKTWVVCSSVMALLHSSVVANGQSSAPSQTISGAPDPARTADSVLAWNPLRHEPYPDVLEVRVGYLPATHDALLFVALEEKLFDAAGVRVVPMLFKNSPSALNALEAGDIDVAIPGIAAPIYRIAAGTDLRIIGGEAWFSAAIVAPSSHPVSPTASPTDILRSFKGKRIATITQSTGDAVLRSALERNGLGADVELVVYETPDKAKTALKAKDVDAALLWSPHMSLLEQESSLAFRTVLWTSQLQKHPCCRQIATAATVSGKTEALVRYLSGIILAKRYMLDPQNKQRVLAAVSQYVSNPPEILERELFQLVEPVKHRWTELSPNVSPSEVNTYVEMMKDARLVGDDALTRVKDRTLTSLLAEAYRRVFTSLSKDDAESCANAGLDLDARLSSLQPVLRTKN